MVRGKRNEMDPKAAAKKPREPRVPKEPKINPPKADNPRAVPTANKPKLEGDEQRRAFLQFNDQVAHHRGKVKLAQDALDEVLTSAKASGFLKKDFDIARDLNDKKKPTKVNDDITRRLRIANWIGHKLGNQFDLFANPEPDRTPVVDRAYDEGKQASMSGKSANPPYDPGHAAHQAYMTGYHDDQKRLGGQFKKLDEATGSASAPLVPRVVAEDDLAAHAPLGDDDFEGDDDETFEDE